MIDAIAPRRNARRVDKHARPFRNCEAPQQPRRLYITHDGAISYPSAGRLSIYISTSDLFPGSIRAADRRDRSRGNRDAPHRRENTVRLYGVLFATRGKGAGGSDEGVGALIHDTGGCIKFASHCVSLRKREDIFSAGNTITLFRTEE